MNGAWTSLVSMAALLAALAGAAWLLRRRFGAAQRGGAALAVIDALSIGPRERVVVVQAGRSWLVLGVAPSGIRALHVMASGEKPEAPFAQALARAGELPGAADGR